MGLKNVFSTLSSTRQQQNRLIDNVFGLLAYFVKSLIPPTPTYSFRRLVFLGFFFALGTEVIQVDEAFLDLKVTSA